ncbi:hypothetical protein QE152_g28325 [Popillia japonica]|uniref:Uncharacterized protein n=1 Tax=Popillia japonica TaxID=7064 RepID=A0AAW1JK97_POPJA
MSRFLETGSVKDRPKVGRPVAVTKEENSLNVMLDVGWNPKTSIQQLALGHNMSRYLIQKLDVGWNPKTSIQQLALGHNMSRYLIQKVVKPAKFSPLRSIYYER